MIGTRIKNDKDKEQDDSDKDNKQEKDDKGGWLSLCMQIGRSGSVECVSMRRGEGGNNKTLFAPLFIQGALGT